ncbi:MAG: glucose 1-dehydrogenase [Rhodospirillaceae bacterium]|nr:MAG: glucose 1-dehydrogenase [Rhodospirillaceae bacterium]
MIGDKTSLKGRVAIVTGGGMGMGAATARLMAARGACVVVSDTNEKAARETVAMIAADGGTAEAVVADVARESDVEAMIAQTVGRFGKLDCAVNNAAIAPDNAPIAEADMAVFDRLIAVNLRGVMLCMKYEIRHFLKRKAAGAIVNIGSVSSQRPQAFNAAYVASKHGVVGLTKTGSLEYASHGIRVNAVLPGSIDTPMLRTALNSTGKKEEDFAPILSLFGRFGKAEEVAEASAWLCSDAASYVTGHCLAVDAGYLSR